MLFLDASNLVNVTSFNILTLGAAYLGTFVGVYIYHRTSKKDMAKENERKFDKKADLDYVRELHEDHEKDIIEIKSSMISIKDDNSKQHGLMFGKIEEVMKGIAEIKGYLSAKKEKD